MKCLDNIYTKQIKYNSPVLYQLESLKKEYEKLLKKYNEIIQIENVIEECYFETNSAIYSNESVSFIGKLNVKTDKGLYTDIDSIIKLNMKGSGEIVVDIDEENKSLIFKIDEEFLSEITLMMETLDSLSYDFNSLKEKFESQIFDNFIGIRNTSDLKIDQIKHINNNFLITSNDGENLLNIDDQLKTISSFGKRIAYLDDIYPVNSLYLSISSTSPAQLFGGVWEQLSHDAYLKIVTSNGGVVGGTSSEHKIPVESMPSHSHVQRVLNTYGSDLYGYAHDLSRKYSTNYTTSIRTELTGGSQAYYPYFYGIYAWIRIE